MNREEWLKVRATRTMRLRDWYLLAQIQPARMIHATPTDKKPEPFVKGAKRAKKSAWDWAMAVIRQRRIVKRSRVS